MAATTKFGKKIISSILNEYGGSTRYSRDGRFTDTYCYDDKINIGAALTIESKIDKDKYTPYIEVRLSDNKGKIIQTDQYEVLFNGTELYKISSHKKGRNIEYINEKIAYVGTNARKSKNDLEQQVKNLSSQVKMLEEMNQRLLNNSEQEFLNSRTYVEMLEKIDYLEAIKRFNESTLADAEARAEKSTAEIEQIYEDNKKFIKNKDNEGYFVGITENWHEAWEYEQLKQEINRLKGHISANTVLMIQKEKMIEDLLVDKAKLKKELSVAKKTTKQKNVSVSKAASDESLSDSQPIIMDGKTLEQIEQEIKIRTEKRMTEYKKPGKKTSMSDEVQSTIIELHKKGYSYMEIARQVGYSKTRVYDYIKTLSKL